ncbi:sphingosine kinase 1 isoform X1 [Lates japonicus]|uniref:Sphingosine kinase 1 isoform X1 n=1 Tax=Lates japonicus TaxID=270547 RepID=A0AAD3NLG3_LATJO|nr:sphingosine kinase 1 isoform X1 [Lates japonicus]
MSELSRPCRMMLLVNPQSGKGQALTLYNNHIQRMLNEASVQHTLVITVQCQITVKKYGFHHSGKCTDREKRAERDTVRKTDAGEILSLVLC